MFRSKGKRQLTPLLDSENYCTQVVIYTDPTRNGRAIGNATLNHIGLHLTDNCTQPIFFQLSSICFLSWTGWPKASQQDTHCMLLHPLPQKGFLCQKPGDASSKHVIGQGQARWVGGQVGVDALHVSIGRNLKKHGLSNSNTSKEVSTK